MMECLFSGRLKNSGDHGQLKGGKHKITLCEGNSYSNICVTTSGEQKYAASESGLAVSLFGKCLDFQIKNWSFDSEFLPTVCKLNSGDHDQLKGEKYKITLCGENIHIQTFV